jgi:prepilin-type processing-associated H-X9-DG protein
LKTIRAPRHIRTLQKFHEKRLGIGGGGDSIGIMKIQPAGNRTEAFTRTELFVVIAVVAVLLVAMLLPALAAAKHKSSRINCINNLHQVSLGFKTWEGDNGDKFPMQFALTNSEAMKLIGSRNAWVLWQTMSNELSTPKILRCPEDTEHTMATSFDTGFSDANISYFFSLEAADTYPQMILDGDDNLAVNGVRVKPGILNLPTTNSLAWTKERHGGTGNIGMADGSVQQTTSSSFNSAVIAATNGAPVSTYRLVIP